MARRKRWRAPNNPTPQAKQVWAALFPKEPWPKGWRVEWAGFMRGVSGLTIYDQRRVLLSYGDLKRRPGLMPLGVPDWVGAVEVLLHEFVHVRAGYRLRHGREFDRLENGLRVRLGLEERP